MGNIDLGTLETNSAQYIAGYVTKKMTRKDHPDLEGRHPEFGRQSLRPGIGADMIPDIASTLLTFNLDTTQADVPSALRHGSRNLPLGRYLKKKLRKEIGKDEKAPQAVIDELQEKMRPVFEAAKLDNQQPSAKTHLAKKNKQAHRNLEANQRTYKKRHTL